MTTSSMTITAQVPTNIARLQDLAYNLWFSWNEDAKALFQKIDPIVWERNGHNPVALLLDVSKERLQQLSEDPAFTEAYNRVLAHWDEYREGPTWFSDHYPHESGLSVAYFSAEFGFHESLPIYSGGLGVLAGDHCKSASDLGIPLTGVGLLYKKGYFRQHIDREGRQIAELVDHDFSRLPIQPAFADGQELVISLPVAERTLFLKVWRVAAGRCAVYLLDADIDQNSPEDRGLTGQLYGGNQDTRIQQEIILGMGGIKALRALGLQPNVYHINEGHAAFMTLERIKEEVRAGLPFHAAIEIVRAATVFTTHTPVPAGHDRFPVGMVEYYLEPLFRELEPHRRELLQLGLEETGESFNMTHLALSTAARRNGVSKLHGEVSRDMFRKFHGGILTGEVPIEYVTNGVHMPTWLAPEMKDCFDRFLPGTWSSRKTNRDQWHSLELVPDESLWHIHQRLKEKMIRFARANLMEQRKRNGEPQERVDEVRGYLSPKALTVGFARRFATYKRANLIFNDIQRLKRLVNDPDRPVQFIFAGKAHPADIPGQEMIREIYRVSQMDEFRGKVVLLENYDMRMARYLVQGVDVWLNNPRRPLEASGTSGQKAAMNGAINFSVLDGWWEEGYNGSNGWAIEAKRQTDWAAQERENTESLYRVFEQEIVPLYYNQGEIPHQWIARMKRSIKTLAPVFNTDRMVQEYTERFYIPNARRARSFSENGYELGIRVADYKRFIRNNWHHVKIVNVDDRWKDPDNGAAGGTASAMEQAHTGGPLKRVTAAIFFGPIWPPDTAVELIYYEENGGAWDPVVVQMEQVQELENKTYLYQSAIPAHLIHGPHFSVRVRPISPSFVHAFELPLVAST